MSAVDRVHLAAEDRSITVSASGLLAEFNDAGVLAPLDVLAASTVARLLDETDERVILAAAMAVRGSRSGNVCIMLEGLRDAIVIDGGDAETVDALPWPEPGTWTAAVEAGALVGDGSTDDRPLVLADGRLYLERYFRYEEQVASLIGDRCDEPAGTLTSAVADALDRFLPSDADDPSPQRVAATKALTGSISVITGGPGTGKTHTIGAMLAALAADESSSFPLVGVCAPTGKAAARLGQALAELGRQIDVPVVSERLAAVNPSTIHRLLGWSRARGQFRHGPRQRLPHEFVIVDEMSMVSLPLFAKLLAAVRDDARIVLVGDPYQLESIEAGTVLADIAGPMAASEPAPLPQPPPVRERITVLDRIYRFESGSVIADFADAIRTGADEHALALLAGEGDSLRWVPDRGAPEFGELWDCIVDQRRRMVELGREPGNEAAALSALTELAVLCGHRRGPESVRQWSRDIETALDDHFTGLRWGGEWYPGRPTMITRNDRNLELYNGDIGVAVETDDGLRVVFEGNEIRSFSLSQLGERTTVHAMTIHKSQGSQFDEIVVVLPGESSRLLTRELLYTAVTRARERVWVVGGEESIRAAVGRTVQRASGLGARLWGDSISGGADGVW